MKKTRKSHLDPPRTHLTLEEMKAYIEDRLHPIQREAMDSFLQDNPLYQETLLILQHQYEEDISGFEGIEHVETLFSKSLEKVAHKVQMDQSSSNGHVRDLGTSPTQVGTPSWSDSIGERGAVAPVWYQLTWVKMAASLVLIVGIAAILIQGGVFTSPAMKLVEANLVHYDPSAVMSGSIEEAIGLYNARKYKEAIPAFENALAESGTKEDRMKLQMYLGVCHTQLDELEASIPYFSSIVDAGESRFFLDASWYLSLVYVKLDAVTKATPLLESIMQYKFKDRRQKELITKAQSLYEILT